MSEDRLKPEDSMEEIEFDQVSSSDTSNITPYHKDFDRVDLMLAQSINLNNESGLHEPTCSICCSTLRTEAEDLWDKNGVTAPISKLFKDNSGLKISSELIKHHMKNHKDGGEKEIRKNEFVDRVRRIYGKNVTTLDQIQLCMAIITDRIMEINSISPSGEHSVVEIEKIKSAEINKLTKTFGDFVKLQATILGEMRNTGEIITIPRERFINVFNDALINAQNDKEKALVNGILNGLKG